MLFNEPKLLKLRSDACKALGELCFSALQRAEIAEIVPHLARNPQLAAVSVLFNEPKLLKFSAVGALMEHLKRFSALQRAEIAEIQTTRYDEKLGEEGFSALQRAEIAEIPTLPPPQSPPPRFQCSSTSRNC